MKKTETYDTGYPTVPIGGGNPYWCCQYCRRPDPQINGILENHLSTCEYRQRRELEIQLGNKTTVDDDLYADRLREVLERFGVMDDDLYDALDELIQPGHY